MSRDEHVPLEQTLPRYSGPPALDPAIEREQKAFERGRRRKELAKKRKKRRNT